MSLGGKSRSWLALWLVSGLGLLACSGDSASERCERDKEHVASCDREFTRDICADKPGRCAAACFGRASCDEVRQSHDGPLPTWLSECLYKCMETVRCEDDGHVIQKRWQCDGENDCVDGSDERGCRYYTCTNGNLVAEDDKCDEWHDCTDRSDELGCGYFLCRDNSRTAARCDHDATCDDGSDEEDCR